MKLPTSPIPPNLDPELADAWARELFDWTISNTPRGAAPGWALSPLAMTRPGLLGVYYLAFDAREGGWFYCIAPTSAPAFNPADLPWRRLVEPSERMTTWALGWLQAKVVRDGLPLLGGPAALA